MNVEHVRGAERGTGVQHTSLEERSGVGRAVTVSLREASLGRGAVTHVSEGGSEDQQQARHHQHHHEGEHEAVARGEVKLRQGSHRVS